VESELVKQKKRSMQWCYPGWGREEGAIAPLSPIKKYRGESVFSPLNVYTFL